MAKKRAVQKGGTKRGIGGGLIAGLLFTIIIRIAYVTGMSLLIPLIFVAMLPEELLSVQQGTTPAIFLSAMLLVAASFFGMLWHKRSLPKTLRALGLVTLVPGAIGILFSIFGREIVFAMLQPAVSGFGELGVFATAYLDAAIPKIRILTFGFVAVGLLLWFVGGKLSSKKVI